MATNHTFSFWAALLLIVIAAGCGKQPEQAAAPKPVQDPASVTSVTQIEQPEQQAIQSSTETKQAVPMPAPQEQNAALTSTIPQTVAAESAAPKAVTSPSVTTEATTEAQSVTAQAANNRDAMLALAKKSGCLTCHAIDRKIVGPAWQDVAKRYEGDAGAKQTLIAKVKKGGSGVWNEITNGAKMPPYSPRVKDEDIEALVMFVLSL